MSEKIGKKLENVKKADEKVKTEEKKGFMPNAWGSRFDVLKQRLAKIKEEYIEAKAGQNYAEQTVKLLNELYTMVDDAFKPHAPRTLKDAHAYALTRKFKATYFALMDEKGNLLKALIIKKGEILDTIPEWKIEDREIQVKMNARLLLMPSLEIERNIPYKTDNIVAFACNPKDAKIQSYK